MEQQNEQLKQTLIKQYSKLSYTSESALIDRLKNIDWWNKEQYRLKVQRKIYLVITCLVFLCFCIVVFYSLKTYYNSGFLNKLLFPLVLVVLVLMRSINRLSRIDEKNRLFELLQLIYDKKKNGA